MRRRRVSAEVDFWPGFTDVLSGMLLSMVFVLTLFAVTQVGLVQTVGGKDAALRSLEHQIEELRRLLNASEERAQVLQRELLQTTTLIEGLGAARDASAAELAAARTELEVERIRAADVAAQLAAYLAQLEELNSKLTGAEEVSENRRAALADLQLAVNRLRAQLAQMSEQLQTAEKEAGKQSLKVSELLTEMARKDERIAELERLEKYTSEFLARMAEVFKDNPNIRVVGDRFVFQSEVLFDSGSDELGLTGRAELNKFVIAFKELIPRLPRDLDVNVQVQGHTDTDKIVLSDRFADNWHLSTARARRVVGYLVERGLPESMLSAAGFGENAPRVRGKSAAAKAQNRRIEIRITRR